jgi:hypothetical protein
LVSRLKKSWLEGKNKINNKDIDRYKWGIDIKGKVEWF